MSASMPHVDAAKKVVSASLFAALTGQALEDKYWVGACLQALAVQELLPDYEFWVHVNDTVPDYIQNLLETLRARVIHVTGVWESSVYGYYWRFLPFGDETVGRVYVCDVDLLLTTSEQDSIREWERTGVSVLYRPWYDPRCGPRRPHEHRRVEEGRLLLACALGVLRPFCIDVVDALQRFFVRLGSNPVYGHDEIFLSKYLWPRLNTTNSIHEVFDDGIVPGRDMAHPTSVLGKRRNVWEATKEGKVPRSASVDDP